MMKLKSGLGAFSAIQPANNSRLFYSYQGLHSTGLNSSAS